MFVQIGASMKAPSAYRHRFIDHGLLFPID